MKFPGRISSTPSEIRDQAAAWRVANGDHDVRPGFLVKVFQVIHLRDSILINIQDLFLAVGMNRYARNE